MSPFVNLTIQLSQDTIDELLRLGHPFVGTPEGATTVVVNNFVARARRLGDRITIGAAFPNPEVFTDVANHAYRTEGAREDLPK